MSGSSHVSFRPGCLFRAGRVLAVVAVLMFCVSAVPAWGQEKQPDPGKQQPKAQDKVSPVKPSETGKPDPKEQGDQPKVKKVKPNQADKPKSPQKLTYRCAETTYDFGEVWAGPKVEHDYIIENISDKPLKITRVKPSCGCTVTKGYDKVIQPGQTGKIPVVLTTTRQRNKISKNIRVTTNDPVKPNIDLRLVGTVKRYVEVTPASGAMFGTVKADQAGTKEVVISNNIDTPLELTMKTPPKQFQAELKETEPGKTFLLTVQSEPPYQSGHTTEFIVLKTNNPNEAEVKVRCDVYLPPRIEIMPKRLSLVSPTSREERRTIRIMNNGEEPFEIVSADVDAPEIEVNTLETKPGKKFQIRLTFPKGFEVPRAGCKITVKTTDEEKPQLTIPITSPSTKTTKSDKPEQRRPAMEMLGKKAPVGTVSQRDGEALAFNPVDGQVTVLDFITSWCSYSRRQLGEIEKFHEKYKDNKDVRLLAVSLDDYKKRTREQVIETLDKLNLHFEMTYDPDRAFGKQYKVTSYPTLFVLGKTGNVEAVHVGAKKGLDDMLAKEVELLLAGKKLPEVKLPKATAATPKKKEKKRRPALDMVGQAASAGTVSNREEGTLAFNPADGKVTVLDFVATWCPYCRRQLPDVEKFYQKYKNNKDVRTLAVSMDDPKKRTRDQVFETLDKLNLGFETGYNPDRSFGKQYKVTSFPTLFVIGKNGQIEAVHCGAKKGLADTLAKEVDLLLAGKTRADFESAQTTAPPTAKKQDEAKPAGEKTGDVKKVVPTPKTDE